MTRNYRPLPPFADRYFEAQAAAPKPKRDPWYVWPLLLPVAILMLALFFISGEFDYHLARIDWRGFDRAANFACKCLLVVVAAYLAYIVIAAVNSGAFDRLVR